VNASSLAAVVEAKRAVIFDLFHTLTSLEATWDGKRPMTHALLGVSKTAWDEQLHANSRDRLAGERTDAFAIVAAMARAIDSTISDDLIQRATENRIARFAGALTGMPATTGATLEALRKRGKRLGLISNADVMEVAAWSQSPVAGLFDSVLFSCHVGQVKPEPEIYRRSLAELGVAATDAIFVGDGGSDELIGAKAVGLTTVMITGIIKEIWPERIGERRRHADFVIETLPELTAPD
jgi:putative hydrolase of the HAD superfamily